MLGASLGFFSVGFFIMAKVNSALISYLLKKENKHSKSAKLIIYSFKSQA